jgi:hypothetical protein
MTLTERERAVDIWTRQVAGTEKLARSMRHVLDQIVEIVRDAGMQSCPGVELEEYGLSPTHLAMTAGNANAPQPHGYPMLALQKAAATDRVRATYPSESEMAETALEILGPFEAFPLSQDEKSSLSAFVGEFCPMTM